MTAAQGPIVDYLPMLPSWRYRLRHGEPFRPGDDTGKIVWKDPSDGSRHSEGVRRYQSPKSEVWSFIVHVKAQGVLTREQVLAELMDPRNVLGAWLRAQELPRVEFDEMWDGAYDTYPRASLEQVTDVLRSVLRDAVKPLPLSRLFEAAAAVGWRRRGDVTDLLDGLVVSGQLRQVRTWSASGRKCVSRTFRLRGLTPADLATQVARRVARGIALRGSGRVGPGVQRPPVGGRGPGLSYELAMTWTAPEAAGGGDGAAEPVPRAASGASRPPGPSTPSRWTSARSSQTSSSHCRGWPPATDKRRRPTTLQRQRSRGGSTSWTRPRSHGGDGRWCLLETRASCERQRPSASGPPRRASAPGSRAGGPRRAAAPRWRPR